MSIIHVCVECRWKKCTQFSEFFSLPSEWYPQLNQNTHLFMHSQFSPSSLLNNALNFFLLFQTQSLRAILEAKKKKKNFSYLWRKFYRQSILKVIPHQLAHCLKLYLGLIGLPLTEFQHFHTKNFEEKEKTKTK